MASQNSDPPASPPEPAEPAGGEPARIRSLDERFGAIESEQASQRGLLEQIRDTITGHPGDGDGDGQTTGGEPARAPNIGAEVQRQIAEADKRRAAEEKDAELSGWRKGVDEALEKLKPEETPREPVGGIRGRIQRALFGSPD